MLKSRPHFLSDVGPFFVALRLCGDRTDAVVAFHPPAVGGMSLADVDHHESSPGPCIVWYSFSMFPEWLRNGPQVKLPNTSTTGLGPISFDRVISALPSLVFRVKSGADSSSLGPG